MSDEICGFSFPFGLTSGSVTLLSAEEKIKQNIVYLLLVGVGERAMNREYGGGLRQLVHDPNNDALRAIAQHQIVKAISRWEPRVQVQDLAITQDQEMLVIRLRYIIRQAQRAQNLDIPIGLGGINA